MNKNKKLNVIRGGVAKQIPGMPNYYFMKGLPHELGGIDIGKDLEVENNEVVHVGKDNIKVYSSVPFLNGVSPAEKVLGGDNPTTVFREQEQFKDINGLKDDGTKKELGGEDDPKNKKKLPFFSINPKEMVDYYTARGFGKTKNGDWGFISKNGHAYDTEEDKKIYDDEYDNLVKIGYIGGTPIEARRKYFDSDKRMTQFVDSVANSHGLPSSVLRNSLANEGFVDHNIKRINRAYSKRRKGGTEGGFNDFGLLGEEVLTDWYDAYNNFGNDDSGTYYKERPDVKRIIDKSGIKPEFDLNSNEKGRTVSTLQSKNNKENIIIHSAILTSFRNEIKKQHPNWTNDQIDNYTLYRFNYGPYAKGNINDVMKRDKFNAKNYEFRLGGEKARYGTEDEIVSDNTRVDRPLTKRDAFLTYQDYAQNEREENFANYVSTIGPTKGTPQGLIDVYPEFDLLTLGRGLFTQPQHLFKRVPKSSVRNPKYYRQVNKASRAIEDAKNTGTVNVKSFKKNVIVKRPNINLSKTFDVPFFNYGRLWYSNKPSLDIIVGSSNKQLRWQPITKSGRFTNRINTAAGRRTPLFNGEANIAPTELFEFYRHYPGIGRLNVTHGFPHMPITGVNTMYNIIDADKKQLGGAKYKPNTYKVGGLYSLIVDGKNSLHQFPSTGKSFARSAKGKVIAKLGTEQKTKELLDNINNRLKKGINPITPTINATLDNIDLISIPLDKAAKRRIAVQRVKNKVNKLLTPDNTALASNVIGSVISHGMNKSMLDDLEYSPKPITRRANKLKTKININPQIEAMRESLAEYRQHVNDNTASSRTARALMNRGLTKYVSGVNTVYANKENQETDLINKDRINQQEITNANIADYNNWRTNKVNFDNSVREKKSENDIGLIGNINAGIQDIISRGEKRFNERQNRLALIAANPNVNPLILRDFGIEGITNEDVRNYYKVYGNKNKKR